MSVIINYLKIFIKFELSSTSKQGHKIHKHLTGLAIAKNHDADNTM